MRAQPHVITVSFAESPLQQPCRMDLIILKASETEFHPKMNREDHLLLCWSQKPPIHTIRNQWKPLHGDTQPYMALFKTTYIHDPCFPCHFYKTSSTYVFPDHPHSTSHLYILIISFLPLCFLQPTTGPLFLM
jgi:hypothetical protein